MKTSARMMIHRRGFTLIEVLTSMAVLSIMLIVWANMFHMATTSWTEGRKKTDMNTKARIAFDMINRDLTSGIFRPDMPAFADAAGDYDFVFYSKREGANGDTRKLSVIRYFTETNGWLGRQTAPIEWDNEGIAFMTNVIPILTNRAFSPAEDQYIVRGIVQMKMQFLTSKSTTFDTNSDINTNSINYGLYADRYFSGCKNVVVTLAIMDEQTMDTLGTSVADFAATNSSKFTDMSEGKAILENIPYYNGGTNTVTNAIMNVFDQSYKNYWDNLMNEPAFYANYPRRLRTGLKVYERQITISPSSDD